MKKIQVDSFNTYLSIVETASSLENYTVLYRGQAGDFPLLPSIARQNPKLNSTVIEKSMLYELKRRTQIMIQESLDDDWDWLTYAQHFGLKTRLLDWSSNPLVALWFACSNESKRNIDSFVYILKNDSSSILTRDSGYTPFTNISTKILRPRLNNERIISQGGWFTSHKFSKKDKAFVPLQKNNEIKNRITEVRIPSKIKSDILGKLNVFGVNHYSLFPDITGICEYINWSFKPESISSKKYSTGFKLTKEASFVNAQIDIKGLKLLGTEKNTKSYKILKETLGY